MAKVLSFGERLQLIKDKINDPKQREKFENAAAPGVKFDRYAQALFNACAGDKSKDQKIVNATMESLSQALMDSVSLGLPIGGALGYGYVVPYRGRVQFQAGYLGLLRMAYNDGHATTAGAEVVYPCDQFEFMLGSVPFVRHKPGKDRSEYNASDIEYAWACISVQGGPPFVAVWSSVDLNKHAERYVRKGEGGKYYSDSLIVTNYEMWCRKTMLRRALKFMPMSEVAREVLQREEYVEEGIDPEPVFASGDVQQTDTLRDLIKSAPSLMTGAELEKKIGGAKREET